MNFLVNDTCDICSKTFVTQPFSGEKTCFVHGNPNGSDFEKAIYAEYSPKHSGCHDVNKR